MRIPIHHGDIVTFSCEGFLPNGAPLEPSKGKETFKIVAGQTSGNRFKKKLSSIVVGMRVKDTKTIYSRECFTPRDETLVRRFQLSALPKDIAKDEFVSFESDPFLRKKGAVQGVISDIRGNEATIDFNHPLAGQDITFNIIILSIKKQKLN